MKKKKQLARIIAAFLTFVILLGLIIPAVSATTMPQNESTNKGRIKTIQLYDLPENFNVEVITAFVGNIETHEVITVDILASNGYEADVELDDGYYIVYANNYSWCDAHNMSYTMNNGAYTYWYTGSSYKQEKYGIDFYL